MLRVRTGGKTRDPAANGKFMEVSMDGTDVPSEAALPRETAGRYMSDVKHVAVSPLNTDRSSSS
jgi:hypothetical protein